jgi:cytochrome c-type biogenesis protein CcsB
MTAALSTGPALFTVTAAAYLGSLAGYVTGLVNGRRAVERLAVGLRLAGLAFHTLFLGARYWEAGVVEVARREEMGVVLTGYERFWTFVSHPPYTNLYESLMFVTWTLMVAYAFIEAKWKLRPVAIPALLLALAGFTEAYIVVEKAVNPVVPALQSWWLLVHVGMIFVAYSLFMLAAIVGVFYLLKVKAKTSVMGAVHVGLMALVTLLAGGVKSLLTRGAFEVVPLAMGHNGKWTGAHWFPPGAGKPLRFFEVVPGVGPAVLVAVLVLLAAAILWWREHRAAEERESKGLAFRVTVAGFALLTGALGLLVVKLATTAPFTPELTTGTFATEPPFRLSVGSNYALGLLAATWAALGLFLGLVLKRDAIVARLPDAKRLDDVVYKVIIVGFPLISIGIVLGGMWAYDAWGRFWGWDPKETWALITWAIYGIYLHVRLTYGAGWKAAAIAVLAFGVVVFTYMGVNLGLTGDGLHVYGQG